MPRQRSLSTATITTAAIAVVDRDGYPSLSMRNVARELGMSTMALYRYVDDRDELERLIADHIWSPVAVDVPEDRPWAERVGVLVGRVRDAAMAHPQTIPLLLRHRHRTRRSLEWIEAMLGVLSSAGFAGSARVIAQRTIVSYLVGAIQTEYLAALDGSGTAAMAAMPVDEFPYLRDTAGTAAKLPPDEAFHGCLQIVLRGLEQDGT